MWGTLSSRFIRIAGLSMSAYRTRRAWRALMAIVVLSPGPRMWPASAVEAAVPPLSTWVTDTTGTLDTATSQLTNTRLAALDKDKGAQIAMLLIRAFVNEAIE